MTHRPARATGQARATLQDQRLQAIKGAVEAFTYSLAAAMAGDEPEFEATVSRALAQRVRAALRPHLDSGVRIRPDFGSYAQLRVEGDLLDSTRPVSVRVEFEDRSMRELSTGRLAPVPRRVVRLTLGVDLDPCVIQECVVHVAPAQPVDV